MNKTFLLGECSDFAKVSTLEISNEHTVVKLPEMINNNFGTTTFVNMEESDVSISENPKPVALPAGFIDMDKRCIRQELLQRFVQRLSLFGNMVVKANQRSRKQAQVAKTLQSQSCAVLRGFDLMSHERYFCSDIGADESVRNDPAAKIFPFRQNSVRGFTVEKYTKILKLRTNGPEKSGFFLDKTTLSN
jgi:hypothetical protein